MIHLVLVLWFVGVSTFKIKLDPSCGVEASSNLIHQNPWVVFLEYWRENIRSHIRCTASLIDNRHLITAAHCVKIPKFTRIVARLGEYDLAKEIDCVNDVCSEPVVRLDVIDIVVHPKYDGRAHDIAVLKLEADAPYTDFIRPICLPTGELQPNTVFVASGWGEIPHQSYYSTTKKIVPLPLWEHKSCKEAYKTFKVPSSVICAGGEVGLDTCRGDSGGPLAWVREKTELWGVTSAGNARCGTKDSPGLYTNVADHIEWIFTVLETLEARSSSNRFSS